MPTEALEMLTAYVPPAVARHVRAEAVRQDRSVSWVVGEALKAWVAIADKDPRP